MKEKKIKGKCLCCGGSGEVNLTLALSDVYQVLNSTLRSLNGKEIGNILGISGPAMCQRLNRLEEMGLAAHTIHKNSKLWRPIKP